MSKTKKPLLPANWRLSREIDNAHKKPDLVFEHGSRAWRKLGKEIPAFNGSQTRRDARKRPITLSKIDWPK